VPVGDPLDRDLQVIVEPWRAAQRIAARDRAVRFVGDPNGEELSRPVGELGSQFRRDVQHQRVRVGGLPDDVGDPDPVIGLPSGHA
jgi:hypothetical protein